MEERDLFDKAIRILDSCPMCNTEIPVERKISAERYALLSMFKIKSPVLRFILASKLEYRSERRLTDGVSV